MADKTIALYMRLSDEDDDKAKTDESNSISHQRKLMMDYVAGQPDLSGCDVLEFSDDGYSGTDFSRPDFQRMMKMVKAGHHYQRLQQAWQGLSGSRELYGVHISASSDTVYFRQ